MMRAWIGVGKCGELNADQPLADPIWMYQRWTGTTMG
jgi:hypothetical protein